MVISSGLCYVLRMANVVIGFQVVGGEWVELDPTDYDSADEFHDAVLELGKVQPKADIVIEVQDSIFTGQTFASKYPEIGWYIGDYSRNHDPDAVVAVFLHKGYLKSPPRDLQGLGPDIDAVRIYPLIADLAEAYMAYTNVPETVQHYTDKVELGQALVRDHGGAIVDSSNVDVVCWPPNSEPLKWSTFEA